MKTKYFVKIIGGVALKRMKGGTVEHFSKNDFEESGNGWISSCFTSDELNNKTTFRKVSRDDARKLHPAAFRSVKKQFVDVKPGAEQANTYRKAVKGLNYKGEHKITAIKEIRTLGSFGLHEALIIVENFDKFLAFVEEHNLLPRVGSRFDDQPFSKA